jgi:outer membrane protein
MADGPDLMAQIAEIRAADNEVRSAKAEYRPKIVLSGSAAQQAIWPSVDYGQSEQQMNQFGLPRLA